MSRYGIRERAPSHVFHRSAWSNRFSGNRAKPLSVTDQINTLNEETKANLAGIQPGDSVRYWYPPEFGDSLYVVVEVTPRHIDIETRPGQTVRFYGLESHAPGRMMTDYDTSMLRLELVNGRTS
ncbi:hypothetical protein [Acidithiobacillus ferriphilus]|uniref:hypothetical protein n=1 Tax=Acidithiobacillus ferriphilus TaxID=1689834 RepID=UPI002DBE1D5C|nr:hypothetical protein [Acidithiobacillus ferriphilus]MEB8535500.1 hypothetical protein [Acidithiobacillus ferriphilus]